MSVENTEAQVKKSEPKMIPSTTVLWYLVGAVLCGFLCGTLITGLMNSASQMKMAVAKSHKQATSLNVQWKPNVAFRMNDASNFLFRLHDGYQLEGTGTVGNPYEQARAKERVRDEFSRLTTKDVATFSPAYDAAVARLSNEGISINIVPGALRKLVEAEMQNATARAVDQSWATLRAVNDVLKQELAFRVIMCATMTNELAKLKRSQTNDEGRLEQEIRANKMEARRIVELALLRADTDIRLIEIEAYRSNGIYRVTHEGNNKKGKEQAE